MSATVARLRSAGCVRRQLLARTALGGALICLSAAVAGPAAAQFSGPPPAPPPGPVSSGPATPPLVLSGFVAVSNGGGSPVINTDGNSADIALHAPRTVIDWSSFNLASGQHATYTFDARNWIVLNRISDTNPSTISGTVQGLVNGSSGGNVWFSARNGIIFGSGAQVDAGGILVTAAAPNLSQFLDASNFTFDFSGELITIDGQIQIESGATLTAHGGLMALISPTVTSDTGSAVNGVAGSNVLYGVAESYRVRLSQGAAGDLDLVDFIVPNEASGSRTGIGLDLKNTTSANSVFVAAVSRTSVASAVINLEGMITAQAAVADGGDIILSGGGGIVGKLAGPTVEAAKPTDFYLGRLTASRDISMVNIGLTLAKPFVAPPPLVILPEDPNCDCTFVPVAAPPPPEPPPPPPPGHGFVDNSFISTLSAGRDIKVTTTQEVDVGEATAARDLSIDAGALLANALTGGRTTALKSEAGLLHVGQLTFHGDTTLVSARNAEVDVVGFASGPTQTLRVQAGGDAILGDGSGDVGGGVINLNAGANAIVNLGGSAKVNSVVAGGSAILQAGSLTVGSVNARQIVAKGGSVSVAQATSAGDIYVISTGGDATLTSATAGDDVYVQATGGTASLANATLTGLSPDEVGASFVGNPDTAGNGRVVSVQSTDLDAKLGLGTGAISGATLVGVKAGQDATVDLPSQPSGALTVVAGRDAILRAPSVNFDAVTAGRDLTLTATVGDLSTTRNLVATRNISLNAAGALSVADITANAGSISLTGRTVTAGALTAGQDLTLRATNGGVQVASYQVGRDLILQGATLNLGVARSSIGRDLSITTPGDFASASDLVAGRNILLDVAGRATVAGLRGADVRVIAGDLVLGGALTATTVEIESRSGALRVGGSAADGAPASGLWVDNAEFGRIHASQSVSFYAGQTAGSARGDLTVLTLDVNPQSTPLVNLFAGGGHNVLVQGTAAPTAPGGAFRIGDASNPAWRPTSILITGAIGAATFQGGTYTNIRDFLDVRLHAGQDILMGSPRFIGLIQSTAPADIQLGRGRPTGVIATPTEQNRVFISAGRLELSADGKVVAQNSSPDVTQSVGVFLTNKASPDLIIDPPQVVDLFGAFLDSHGHLVSNLAASTGLSFQIVDGSGNPTAAPTGVIYRFNSCTVGTDQCSVGTQLASSLSQDMPALGEPSSTSGDSQGDNGGSDSSGGSDQASAADAAKSAGARAGSDRNSPRPLLGVAPSDPQAALSDPVATGAGSEEIWRKREVKP